MPKDKEVSKNSSELRERAKAKLAREAIESPDLPPEEARRLIQKLRTHQIELEMQNEELRQTQQALAESRDRYSNLYDSAPIGYMTSSDKDMILESNLTLAKMLGIERQALLKESLSSFVLPADEDIYYLHRRKILDLKKCCSCSLRMLRKNSEPFWAEIDSTLVETGDENDTHVRTTITDITERKGIELALNIRENQYRGLFENSLEGLAKTSVEGKIIIANLAFAQMLGYESPEEVVSSLIDLKKQLYVDSHRRKELTNRLHRDKELKNVEIEFYRKDGTRIWVNLNTRLIYKTNGDISHYESVVSDASERRLARETLQKERGVLERTVSNSTAELTELNQRLVKEIEEKRETEKELRVADEQLITAQRTAKIGNWERNLETGQLSWSDEVFRIFGVRRDDFTTLFDNFVASVIPEDRARINEAIADAIERKIPYVNEYRIRTPSGEIRNLHSTGQIEFNELGKPVRMFGIVQDVTDRKIDEKVRHKTEARLATILDGTVDAIISVDRKERIIVFNKGAETVFGYREKEIIGKSIEILIPEDKHEAHKRAFAEFLKSSTYSSLIGARAEISGKRRNGNVFPAEASLTKQDVEGELVLTAVLRDITDRKQIEQQLLQAQRVEAVGLLAGGVAHDFNNNLSALLMNSELAQNCLEPDNLEIQECKSFLKEMNFIAEKSSDLTQQLLAFSSKEIVERRIIRMEDVLAAITEMLKRLVREDVNLETTTGSDLYPINASESHIERILVNLAINSRDAMPNGGHLKIKVENTDVLEPIVEAKVTPGKYVRIIVQDTGMGMSKETLDKIFEPFFTTKPKGKGTGLGLATVHRILTEMGGIITVSSVLGKGSQITIYIPAVDSHPQENTTNQLPRSPQPSKGETILYCEDEKSVREIISRSLKKAGYRVLTAEHGADALKIANFEETIDLLITDVVMPEMDGKELSKRIIQRFPSIKVLFVSGYASDVLTEHDIATSSISFLAKPFNKSRLLHRVREHLDTNEQAPVETNGDSFN